MKRTIIALACVVVIVLGIRLVRNASKDKRADAGAGAPAPVTVAAATSRAVPMELRTFGTVEPLSTVEIRSQVSGTLTKVHIREGQDVQPGELLFTVDPRPMETAVKQAQAILDRDTGNHATAVKEAERQEELFKKNLVAEEVRERFRTVAEALAATVKADEAALENAQLQLEYCSIRSPVSGRAGAVMVHEGNLVKANDSPLLTINQIQPIQVAFAVPQQELTSIMKEMSERPLEVRATISDSDSEPEKGELTFVDNQVDRTTGTIELKGTFANDDRRLWPGLFVNVVLVTAVESNALVIPFQAVQSGQKGSYVYVVKPDGTVEDRVVTVERLAGAEAVLADGLKASERVVTDGQLRLRPGARVDIQSTEKASGSSAP